MRTSIISLLAITAATVVAQSDSYLVTREEFGDALVNLYIREATLGAVPGSDVQFASQILPHIKNNPRLLRRYAEADPSFKSFFKKIGHGLKKVGSFALKGISKVAGVASKVAPMVARDTESLDMYGDSLEVRDFDDQLEVREYDDDQLEIREFDGELEVREYDDQLETRDVDEEVPSLAVREWIDMYNGQFEAREFDEDLYAREFYEGHQW